MCVCICIVIVMIDGGEVSSPFSLFFFFSFWVFEILLCFLGFINLKKEGSCFFPTFFFSTKKKPRKHNLNNDVTK